MFAVSRGTKRACCRAEVGLDADLRDSAFALLTSGVVQAAITLSMVPFL